MKWTSIVVSELVGLFVDDGSLAFAILLLVGILAGVAMFGLLPPIVAGAVLLVGLLLILIENLTRSANRLRRR